MEIISVVLALESLIPTDILSLRSEMVSPTSVIVTGVNVDVLGTKGMNVGSGLIFSFFPNFNNGGVKLITYLFFYLLAHLYPSVSENLSRIFVFFSWSSVGLYSKVILSCFVLRNPMLIKKCFKSFIPLVVIYLISKHYQKYGHMVKQLNFPKKK